jgi:hypothetical protein
MTLMSELAPRRITFTPAEFEVFDQAVISVKHKHFQDIAEMDKAYELKYMAMFIGFMALTEQPDPNNPSPKFLDFHRLHKLRQDDPAEVCHIVEQEIGRLADDSRDGRRIDFKVKRRAVPIDPSDPMKQVSVPVASLENFFLPGTPYKKAPRL